MSRGPTSRRSAPISDPGRLTTAPSSALREVGWTLAIGLAAVAVRLAFAREYVGSSLGRFPWVDEASYWSWARAIAGGQWLPARPFYQDPLYPYWLAGLVGVLGPEVARLRLASAGLGAITPMLVAGLGRRALGPAEGLAAGWALAFYGPLIFADGSLEKEGLAAFGTALALGLTARSIGSKRPGLASAAAGAGWGAVGLLRSNALLVGLAGPVVLAFAGDRRAGTPGRRKPALAFLAGFAAALAPAVVVNTAVSRPRELLGSTWQLGANFYIGNGPEATGTYAAPAFVRANPAYEAADFAAEASRRSGRELSPGEVSRYWLGRGLRRWADAPMASLGLLARKLGWVLHREEIPDNQDLEFVRIAASPALAWGFVDFGMLLPLAAVGLPRALRSPFGRFLAASTALGLGSTALFFVVGRYRVPWAPGLALLAGVGLVDLGRLAARRDGRGLAGRLALLALPAAALAWWPRADPVPGRWGRHLFTLGLAELRSGRLDPAIDAFDLARAFSPDSARFVDAVVAREPVRPLMARLVAESLAAAGTGSGPTRDLRRARLLRQLPGGPAQSRALLDAPGLASADPSRLHRERGLAWLTLPGRPGDRPRAIREFAEAAPGDRDAALLLALAAGDPAALGPSVGDRAEPGDVREALVRAILAGRPPAAR